MATCEVCGKKFSKQSSVLRHRRESHQPVGHRLGEQYPCQNCGHVFKRDWDLRRHEGRRHWQQRSFSSEINPKHDAGLNTESTHSGCNPAVSMSQDLSKASAGSGDAYNKLSSNSKCKRLATRDGPKQSGRRKSIRHKPLLCTICRQPFDLRNIERLLKHLNDHFRELEAGRRCRECEITFFNESDLMLHQRSAAGGHCGFAFSHSVPCTGHHRPSTDHLSLQNQLRNWEQCQLAAFISRVEQLRKRKPGSLHLQTEGGSTCRGCRILTFIAKEFPDDHQQCLQQQQERNESHYRRQTACCDVASGKVATERLILRLTAPKVRASSVDAIGSDCKPSWDVGLTDSTKNFEEDADATYLLDPMMNLFHWSAYAGDTVTVRQCLLQDADVNGRDLYGRTAAHWAALAGAAEVIEVLQQYGARLDLADHDGCTALHIAVINQSGLDKVNEAAALLLQATVSVHAADHWGRTCLHIAAEVGHAVMVELLLSYGAKIDAVNALGQTPLLLAAREGHLVVVMLLCELGANVDSQNSSGYTASHSAIDRRMFEVALYLLERGAQASDIVVQLARKRKAEPRLVELLEASVASQSSTVLLSEVNKAPQA